MKALRNKTFRFESEEQSPQMSDSTYKLTLAVTVRGSCITHVHESQGLGYGHGSGCGYIFIADKQGDLLAETARFHSRKWLKYVKQYGHDTTKLEAALIL